jgi:hypothetical protein
VRASHRGKVVQAADDVIGLVVNTAARATEAAAGGELVVTAPVLEGARNLTGVSFDGPHAGSFRGIQEQVQVYFASRDARPPALVQQPTRRRDDSNVSRDPARVLEEPMITPGIDHIALTVPDLDAQVDRLGATSAWSSSIVSTALRSSPTRAPG